jgi:hypothetical protein
MFKVNKFAGRNRLDERHAATKVDRQRKPDEIDFGIAFSRLSSRLAGCAGLVFLRSQPPILEERNCP